MNYEIKTLLEDVRDGNITVEQAIHELKTAPFKDIGYAKVDTHRSLRNGVGEVIYGAGKTAKQLIGIISTMKESGQNQILITRISQETCEEVNKIHSLTYYKEGNLAIIGNIPPANGKGTIVIATGGTSDIPVAEEAALTAEFLGNSVTRLYDVGVAGLHRTLAHIDDIVDASVIIAIAGMEGALASVLGGLAECPVIAVPTSVGYGASFCGISALLSMINSCANGISVVNIDNGFGAAYQASLINHH
ncbi:nickel pincer cofactor biosynthesis protein LarB [Pseudobutyrivibrio xylanivorans]|uniref:Nickel pincer cofactor biosynthesis protein LarB n=1 Tax=Pseudobutyrivibrio xylanivorans TaxID=185007 RepID=A0A5P6VPG2_PSEXY|nr:nickel pincer cofactor biosynthesis protein LarB [Pseudobutyrivibrio xylanivorans]QFJ54292.1 nickel pincer cofactor biosynthesis protein LarB [Pseudobutyrivibrio xylanivorans]